ncbi:hypothetical protein AB0J35_02535 [Nonomuraea angiospora]|uniref:hypothetical protein n=1 Tax=Nonomuraea angiospora TaxID=46172 RepID=UPI0034120F52
MERQRVATALLLLVLATACQIAPSSGNATPSLLQPRRHPAPVSPGAKLAPDGTGGVLLGSRGVGLGNTWRLAPDGATTRLPRMKVEVKASRRQYGEIQAMAHIPGTGTVLAAGTLSARNWSRPAIAEFTANGE